MFSIEGIIIFALFIGFIALVSFFVNKLIRPMAEDAAFLRSMNEDNKEHSYSDRVDEAAGVHAISGNNPNLYSDLTNAGVMNKK